MSEATQSAVGAKEEKPGGRAHHRHSRPVAGACRSRRQDAEHRSTENNMQASDLFNFYQAKKIRSTVAETAAGLLEAQKNGVADPKAQEAFDKGIANFKATVTDLKTIPRRPHSLEKIQERAKEATERREIADRRLEHFNSEAVLRRSRSSPWPRSSPCRPCLAGGALGALGAALVAFGFFAPQSCRS